MLPTTGDYNVFLSWSGETSGHVAGYLCAFIEKVVPKAHVFLSKRIDPGTSFIHELASALKECKVGIVCLTPDNMTNTWIHYEAGAIAKELADGARLCTYLLDGATSIVGPLQYFQRTMPDRDGTKGLVMLVNKAINQGKVAESLVDANFDTYWSSFERVLDGLPPTKFQKVFGKYTRFKVVYSELKMAKPLQRLIDAAVAHEADGEQKIKLAALKTHYLVPTDPEYDLDLLFRGEKTACVCEVRSSGYLTSALARNLQSVEGIVADHTLKTGGYAQSVISLGAKDNSVTARLLRSVRKLVDIDVTIEGSKKVARIVSRLTSGSYLAGPPVDHEDFGLIVGITPPGQPDKKWIACAGLGEHGTSGAAYFLANRWCEIAEKVLENGCFACIVRVLDEDDSGAYLYRFALQDARWTDAVTHGR